MTDKQFTVTLSSEDLAQLHAVASAQGVSAAEWCRRTIRAQAAKTLCAAQSCLPGFGVHCYCTEPPGHKGDHVARTHGGEIVHRWPS